MREIVLPLAVVPGFLASMPMKPDEVESWWEKAQKHGVGFVFFVFFLVLMFVSYRREKKAEADRTKRETEANAERIALQTQIRDLTAAQLAAAEEHGKRQLAQSTAHARKLEGIIEEGNRVQVELAANIKTLARRVNCPVAVTPSQSSES